MADAFDSSCSKHGLGRNSLVQLFYFQSTIIPLCKVHNFSKDAHTYVGTNTPVHTLEQCIRLFDTSNCLNSEPAHSSPKTVQLCNAAQAFLCAKPLSRARLHYGCEIFIKIVYSLSKSPRKGKHASVLLYVS